MERQFCPASDLPAEVVTKPQSDDLFVKVRISFKVSFRCDDISEYLCNMSLLLLQKCKKRTLKNFSIFS